MKPRELREKLESGQAVAVDVTLPELYRQRHIWGALSVPFPELEARWQQLPKDREVVLYCSWPGEVLSARAALFLGQRGLSRVAVLAGGLKAWAGAGYRTAGEALDDALLSKAG